MIQSPLKPRRRITGVYDQSSMHPANAGPAMRQQPQPQDGLPQQRPPMPQNAGLAQRGTARFGGVVSPQQAQRTQPQGPVRGQAQPWGRRMFTGGGGMSMPQADFGGTKPRLVGAGAVPPQTFNAPPPSAWSDGSGARSVYDQQGQEGYAAGSVWSSMNPDADVQQISRDPLDRTALAQDFRRRFGAASQASDRLRGELDSRLGALTFEDDSGISGLIGGDGPAVTRSGMEGAADASNTGGSSQQGGGTQTSQEAWDQWEREDAAAARDMHTNQAHDAGEDPNVVEWLAANGYVITNGNKIMRRDTGEIVGELGNMTEGPYRVARAAVDEGWTPPPLPGEEAPVADEGGIPENLRSAYEDVMNQDVPTIDSGAIDEKVAADQAAQAMAEARSMRAMLEMSARAGMSPGAAAAATQAQSMESGIAGVQRDANTRLNLTVRNHEAALRQYDNQIASLMSMAEYLKGTAEGEQALARAMALARQQSQIQMNLAQFQDDMANKNLWRDVGLSALGSLAGAAGSAAGYRIGSM